MQRFVRSPHGAVVTLLAIVSLSATACGHGHRRHHPQIHYGTLEVFNSRVSDADVDGVETRSHRARSGSFKPVVAPPGTGVFFDLVTGHYDVVVFWDTGSHDTFFDVGIDHDRTTTLRVRF